MTGAERRKRKLRNALKAALFARLGRRPCPLCDGKKVRPAGASHMHAHLCCGACGLVYVADLPPAEDLRRAYQRVHLSDYQTEHKADWGPWIAHKQRTLDALGLWLPGCGCAGGPSALDLGCGEGAMMGVLAERGWQPHGLELNPVLAAEARQAGHAVWEGSLEDPALPEDLPRPVELAVMNHIIEHLRDPFAALVRVRKLLRPGGALVLETPQNPDFENIDHLHYFSAAALELALKRAGLTPERWFDYVDDNYGHHNLAVLARR